MPYETLWRNGIVKSDETDRPALHNIEDRAMVEPARRLVIQVKFLGGALGVIFGLGFGLQPFSYIPNHAQVILNEDKLEYFAPQCLPEDYNSMDFAVATKLIYMDPALRIVPIERAYEIDAISTELCKKERVWFQDQRSPSGMLLQKIGLLSPIEPRWNEDGTWNW